MTPTAPARADAAPSAFADRLKDPSLLRDRCFIDGAWVGTPQTPVTNPVNGIELAKVPRMATEETTAAVEAAERAFRIGPSARQRNVPTSCGAGST